MFSFSRDDASSGQQRPFPALPKFLTKENSLYFVLFLEKLSTKWRKMYSYSSQTWSVRFFLCQVSYSARKADVEALYSRINRAFRALWESFECFFVYRLCKNCPGHFIVLLHANRLRVDDHYVPDEWFIGCIWWLCRQVLQSEYVTDFVNHVLLVCKMAKE